MPEPNAVATDTAVGARFAWVQPRYAPVLSKYETALSGYRKGASATIGGAIPRWSLYHVPYRQINDFSRGLGEVAEEPKTGI